MTPEASCPGHPRTSSPEPHFLRNSLLILICHHRGALVYFGKKGKAWSGTVQCLQKFHVEHSTPWTPPVVCQGLKAITAAAKTQSADYFHHHGLTSFRESPVTAPPCSGPKGSRAPLLSLSGWGLRLFCCTPQDIMCQWADA